MLTRGDDDPLQLGEALAELLTVNPRSRKCSGHTVSDTEGVIELSFDTDAEEVIETLGE